MDKLTELAMRLIINDLDKNRGEIVRDEKKYKSYENPSCNLNKINICGGYRL